MKFAAAIAQGDFETVVIPERRLIEVSTTNEALVFLNDRTLRAVAAQPLRLHTGSGDARVRIQAVSGTANYTIYSSEVVPLTGDRALSADDDSKIFRCDDGSNITVTVPADLPECFSAGFIMWGAGTITISAGSGATNRSSTSAINTQYQWGSLLIAKNADDASAEFVLGGGFA